MDERCSTNGSNEKLVLNFSQKYWKGETTLKTLTQMERQYYFGFSLDEVGGCRLGLSGSG